MGWPIQAALNAKYPDKVICSTDDEEIAGIAMQNGAEVPFIRPKVLAEDATPSSLVVEHAIRFFLNGGEDFDYLVMLQPTSPLTEPSDVDSALEQLESKRDIADSIVGVGRVVALHPDYMIKWLPDGRIMPAFLPEFSYIKRRQEVTEIGIFVGSLFISDVRVFLDKMSFCHDRTIAYIVQRWKSLEIDDFLDLVCIEAVLNNLDNIKGTGDEK